MRANIEDYDAFKNEEEDEDEYDADNNPIVKPRTSAEGSSRLSFSDRIIYEAPEKPTTIAELAATDHVAIDLHLQLTTVLEQLGISSMDNQNIKVEPNDQVCIALSTLRIHC